MAKQEKRKYQERDLKDIILKVDSGKNVMYQLPTGGGKSVVASDFVHNYHTEEVLILAHRRELILQMEDRLSSDKIIPGVIVGDIQRNLDSNILIGSVQTLSKSKRLETILKTPRKLVIVDEAHRLRTPSYDKILNHLREVNPDIRIVGLSATPWRADKKDFREYIDELICSETVDSLIKEGYLCNFRTYVTNIGDIDKEVEKNENDYNIASLSKYMRQDIFLQHAVDQYKEKGEDRQALIFAVDKLHLKAIIEKFKANGLDSIKEIHAETPQKERDLALKEYREGQLKFIVSIDTMIEGVDLPETGCLIVLRPTESLVVFHQLLGRGMRRKADGSDLIILDCAGVTKKHGAVNSPRTWSLDPNVDPKQNTRRNKIVGKRKDGSYTDDIKEIEKGDLEVIEMTPEEYIEHSSNIIEEAEKYNKGLRELIISKFQEFKLELLKNITLTPNMIIEVSESRYDRDELYFKLDKAIGEGYSISFRREREGGILLPELSRPWSGRNNILDLKANKYIGELSAKILENPSLFDNTNLEKEIRMLEKSEIDVDKIKQKQESFKRDQLTQKLDAYLQINNTIKFEKSFQLGNIFPTQYGRIQSMVFTKNKLLSTNEVSFRNAEDREHYLCKWFEKSKLIDLLVEQNWTDSPVQEEVEKLN